MDIPTQQNSFRRFTSIIWQKLSFFRQYQSQPAEFFFKQCHATNSIDDHTLTEQEILERYVVSKSKGLNQAEAEQLLLLYGRNEIEMRKFLPQRVKLLPYFVNSFTGLLLLSSLLYFVKFNYFRLLTDLVTGCIFSISGLLTAVLLHIQTYHQFSLDYQFQQIAPHQATVKRNGYTMNIAAAQLVPGDIVIIQKGDIIPADMVILTSKDLKVRNDAINGNNTILPRLAEPTPVNEDSSFESIIFAKNSCFYCTICTSGYGEGIVIATGKNTVVGKTMLLTDALDKPQSEFHISLFKLIRQMSMIMLILAITSGTANYIKFGQYGLDFIFQMNSMYSRIVPAWYFVNIAILIAVHAKAVRDCSKTFVRNFEAIQELENIDCAVFEKSGTIQENELMVWRIVCSGKIVHAAYNYGTYHKRHQKFLKNLGAKPKEPQYDITSCAFQALCDAIALTTEASFMYEPTMEKIIEELADQEDKNPLDYPYPPSLDTSDKQVEIFEKENETLFQKYVQIRQSLIESNSAKLHIQRQTQGDLNEIGLVKFVQPIYTIDEHWKERLTDAVEVANQVKQKMANVTEGGENTQNSFKGDLEGIDILRYSQPIVEVGSSHKHRCYVDQDAQTRFTMFIRDRSPTITASEKSQDLGYAIYVRGTPQLILDRSTSTLDEDGKPVPITEEFRKKIKHDIRDFDFQGQRSTAFAQIFLDRNKFSRSWEGDTYTHYPFKISQYKSYLDETNETVRGAFPLRSFTLVGIVCEFNPPIDAAQRSLNQLMKTKQLVLMTGDEIAATVPLAKSMKLITDSTNIQGHKEYGALLKEALSNDQDYKQYQQELRALSDAKKAFNQTQNRLLVDLVGDDSLKRKSITAEELNDIKRIRNEFQIEVEQKETRLAELRQLLVKVKLQTLEKLQRVVFNGDEHYDLIETPELFEQLIQKKEIIVCRSLAEQKAKLVKAIQGFGKKVMMIGDGVNDLPGLKQANVGFCMGSGSQLAMTVSDITLKKNDLTVVYKAVTVGVRLQQNYLKLVNFMLPGTLMHFIFQIIDNMTELPAPPVTLFMSLMYNLVFATINCLSICVSDVEQDKPKGIIASPYYWFFGMGLFQTVAAYITYFSVLNDYGIKPATAWTIQLKLGQQPQPDDIYIDDLSLFNGNTIMQNDGPANSTLDWISMSDSYVDIRLFYGELDSSHWSTCRWTPDVPLELMLTTPLPTRDYSPQTQQQVCYSTEAIKYAQSAAFTCLLFLQLANLLSVQYAHSPVFEYFTSLNRIAFILVEVVIIILLNYIDTMHYVFGTRSIAYIHFVTVWPIWFFMIIALAEVIKFLEREKQVVEQQEIVEAPLMKQNSIMVHSHSPKQGGGTVRFRDQPDEIQASEVYGPDAFFKPSLAMKVEDGLGQKLGIKPRSSVSRKSRKSIRQSNGQQIDDQEESEISDTDSALEQYIQDQNDEDDEERHSSQQSQELRLQHRSGVLTSAFSNNVSGVRAPRSPGHRSPQSPRSPYM